MQFERWVLCLRDICILMKLLYGWRNLWICSFSEFCPGFSPWWHKDPSLVHCGMQCCDRWEPANGCGLAAWWYSSPDLHNWLMDWTFQDIWEMDSKKKKKKILFGLKMYFKYVWGCPSSCTTNMFLKAHKVICLLEMEAILEFSLCTVQHHL